MTKRLFYRRLVKVGTLDVPQDVFHLKPDELGRVDAEWQPSADLVGELRTAVVRRKARRAELEGTPLVDLPAQWPFSLLSLVPPAPQVSPGFDTVTTPQSRHNLVG